MKKRTPLIVLMAGLAFWMSSGPIVAGSGADAAGHTLEGLVEVAWVARPGAGVESFRWYGDMTLSPDGSRLFATAVTRTNPREHRIVALDADSGDTLWVRSLPWEDGTLHRLDVTPDGSTLFAIDRRYLYAIDTDSGDLRWKRSTSRLNVDMVISPDASIVYVAAVRSLRGPWDPVPVLIENRIQAYDALDGSAIWTSSFFHWYPEYQFVWGLAVSPDGSQLFLLSNNYGSCEGASQTVALDTITGEQTWVSQEQGCLFNVALSPDGESLFATGLAHHGTWSDSEYFTIARDTTSGESLWSARYHAAGGGTWNEAYRVMPSRDGTSVFVSGKSHGLLTGADIATVAYDSGSGQSSWVTRQNGPISEDDYLGDMDLLYEPEGVVTTGSLVFDHGRYEFSTVGYAQNTGARLWSARYDDPEGIGLDSRAFSVSTSHDGGRAYVAGGTYEPIENDLHDVVIIAYDLVLAVDLDVKPGSENNPVNLKSKGVIPAAILGSDSLDVSAINPSTCRFGPWEAAPAHYLEHPDIHGGHLEDVNGDGRVDLVLHFHTQETGIACGDTEVALTGELESGRPFEGVDSILTKGCR